MIIMPRTISLALLSFIFVSDVSNAQDLIFTDSFEICTAGETVDWDGGGDGTSWNDELNWEDDVLPVDGDAVSIRRGGLDTVIYNSGMKHSESPAWAVQRRLALPVEHWRLMVPAGLAPT